MEWFRINYSSINEHMKITERDKVEVEILLHTVVCIQFHLCCGMRSQTTPFLLSVIFPHTQYQYCSIHWMCNRVYAWQIEWLNIFYLFLVLSARSRICQLTIQISASEKFPEF